MNQIEYEHIDVSAIDGVATITMNRPEVLNANDSKTHGEISTAFLEMSTADSVRAIIITGAGRAFCAGSDLRAVGRLKGKQASEYVELDFRTKNSIAGCGKPVIAAINGYCYGGGLEIALACDIRIASVDAVFKLPEIGLGTLPGSGGLQRLPQVVGHGIASEWALLGREVDSDEAYFRGLVNRLVQPDQLLGYAEGYARQLAGLNPDALRFAKVALDPTPPAGAGMIAAFHGMASRICHDEPGYDAQTSEFRMHRG